MSQSINNNNIIISRVPIAAELIDKARRYNLLIHTRSKTLEVETSEKPVLLPAFNNTDAGIHAWCEARFVIDILAEHAFFFVLLMPIEVAPAPRAEAQRFHQTFVDLYQRIDSQAPPANAQQLKQFTDALNAEIIPFIAYKHRMGDAQKDGSLRSLVWPLFFEHTRHEAERWVRRLTELGRGEIRLNLQEVQVFGTEIMEDHAQFIAHLLDPTEFELIRTALIAGKQLQQLHDRAKEPHEHKHANESDSILQAAQSILSFKTTAARGIEAARIKSIIDPRLADHVRREALKFVDELRRTMK